MTEKLPLDQDMDYISSYADGIFLKLDSETSTVRLVFYKKEIELPDDDEHTTLSNEFVKNLMFEVRLPNSALTGLLDIAHRFNRYREELDKGEEAMADQEISESFLRFSETLAISTFDTSDPAEHDIDLNKKFSYYLLKREAKEGKKENNEPEPE